MPFWQVQEVKNLVVLKRILQSIGTINSTFLQYCLLSACPHTCRALLYVPNNVAAHHHIILATWPAWHSLILSTSLYSSKRIAHHLQRSAANCLCDTECPFILSNSSVIDLSLEVQRDAKRPSKSLYKSSSACLFADHFDIWDAARKSSTDRDLLDLLARGATTVHWAMENWSQPMLRILLYVQGKSCLSDVRNYLHKIDVSILLTFALSSSFESVKQDLQRNAGLCVLTDLNTRMLLSALIYFIYFIW